MGLKRSISEEDEPIQKERPEYNENVWMNAGGKIDGYTFKGKKSFGKALQGLRGVMKKGITNAILDVKYTALDSRIQGAGLEIDVEILSKNQRGNAILKIYGPKENDKKDNTVTITKSKKSDSKFIVLLAEKVVRPLMNGFLTGDLEIKACTDIDGPIFDKSSTQQFRCSFCEKVCKTPKGLKGHITRMHLREENEKTNKRKSMEDIGEVVEEILLEVVNGSENESIESIEEKKYTKKCDNCEIELQTHRKYLLLQKFSEHKDQCISKMKCIKCNKRFKDEDYLKNHVCGNLKANSVSKSPPHKKKRNEAKEDEKGEVMEVNTSIEEMEIDGSEEDDNVNLEEAEVLALRSKQMDDKVLAKEKKNKEEELDYQNQKKMEEEKKKAAEMDLKTKINSKKQKMKDERKKKNKKQKVFKVPNIIEVPRNCRNLVSKDDVVYQVPGDGACGPNCGAAFLFEDEVFGHKLRKNMNNFFADHFYENYQYLTQCSPGYPFRRRVKGQIVEFIEPEKLIKYLKSSEDAKYMWSDSEDLTVLADMYQIRIKIITTKGEEDENPIINWIYPNKALAKYAEIKDVDIEDMVLLHTNDVHFDLIVSKDSKLATMGSLSFRHNIGPMSSLNVPEDENEDKEKPDEKFEENHKKVEEISNISSLQMELKDCRESKIKLEKQYEKCETELRNMTEAYEKMKIENQNLKQKIELNKRLEINSALGDLKSNERQMDENDKVPNRFKYVKQIGEKGDSKNNTSKSVNKHMKSVHTEATEFNCIECPYQATSEMELNKHINLKHRLENQRIEEVIHCRYCGEQFAAKWNLMNHRKQKHPNLVAFCEKYKENDCKYNSEVCWWRHVTSDNDSKFKCFTCSKIFKTKGEMMVHRKREHVSSVKTCENFKQNTCRFRSNFCWFLHGEVEENLNDHKVLIEDENKRNVEKDEEAEKDNEEKSVFRKAVKSPIIR